MSGLLWDITYIAITVFGAILLVVGVSQYLGNRLTSFYQFHDKGALVALGVGLLLLVGGVGSLCCELIPNV